MAAENVVTNSTVGLDGNSYTTSISNDQLTNDDFLKLMLEEMKMQDPTKPMDSQALMDSTLQMSSIDANNQMSAGMKSLEAAYASSSLATSAGLIGHVVENGSIGDNGLIKSYKVDTVESRDGELYLNARAQTGIKDALVDSTSDNALVLYDSDGYIYDGEDKTDIKISLDHDGRFTFNDDGTLKLLDSDGEVITDEDITDKYLFAGSSAIYSENRESFTMASVTQVR